MTDIIRPCSGLDPSTRKLQTAFLHEFWNTPSTTQDFFVVVSGVGGGSSIAGISGVANAVGLAVCNIGTSAGGRGWFASAATLVVFTGGAITLELPVFFSALSDGTDRYLFMGGLLDVFTGAAPVDGAWFSYQDNVNSGNWTINASVGSTAVALNGGIAVTQANQILRIEVNATATEIHYYVNDVECTNSPIITSANIPGATSPTGIGFGMLRVLGTSNARLAYVDYVYFRKVFTTARK